MANINVRREEQPRSTNITSTEWEPARVLRQFFGWDPFREMEPLLRNPPQSFMPAFEIKETKDGYLFKADLPGVREQDVDVTLTDNRLQISGKRDAEKEERTDTYFTYERSYGSFSRAFTLPNDVDTRALHAELRDGVLTLHVPRKPEAQPKKIPLKSGAPKA